MCKRRSVQLYSEEIPNRDTLSFSSKNHNIWKGFYKTKKNDVIQGEFFTILSWQILHAFSKIKKVN